MMQCLQAGKIVDVPELPTLSTSTAGGIEHGSITFSLCQTVIDRFVTVSEAEIAGAMRLIAEREHWLIEGAAGVAVSGLVKLADHLKGKKVAIVLCGRNLSINQLKAALA